MQVTIKAIQQESKISKNSGKAFISCRLQVFSSSQNKDVWLSGFGDAMTETWSVGDVVDIDIIPNGEYFNWKSNENTKPSPDKKLEILRRIETKLDILLGKKDAQEITRSSGEVVIQNYSALGNPVNPTEVKVEDIPF